MHVKYNDQGGLCRRAISERGIFFPSTGLNVVPSCRIKNTPTLWVGWDFYFGRVAEFVGISLWDVPDLLKKHKVNLNYDEEELKYDLGFIKKWGKK